MCVGHLPFYSCALQKDVTIQGLPVSLFPAPVLTSSVTPLDSYAWKYMFCGHFPHTCLCRFVVLSLLTKRDWFSQNSGVECWLSLSLPLS